MAGPEFGFGVPFIVDGDLSAYTYGLNITAF